MAKPERIVCFGELLLRLGAPRLGALFQSPELVVRYAGAEINAAVSLARLGLDAAVVTVLPENALGQAAVNEVRRYGVDVSGVVRAAGRMGLYFLTQGAMHRPSDIIYDRANSAFAMAAPDLIDWKTALKGADWLHVSGVTPAISVNAAAAALRAVKAARAAGVKVAFDGNFRGKLWAVHPSDPKTILPDLLAEADLAFIDHRDLGLITGKPVEPGAPAAALAFSMFPHLQRIANTIRKVETVDHNKISGQMFTRAGGWTTPAVTLFPIVDRIGGGDAFAAGLLYGLATGLPDQEMLDFAMAATSLKHSIPGDFNLSSVAEIRAFMSENRFDVRR